MKKRRSFWITGLLIALGAAAVIGYRGWASSRASSAGDLQTGVVSLGSLTSTLSSSGTARTGQTATVSWEMTGKVGEVTLAAGDTVVADQVLAALDPNELSTTLINARQSLIDAQQAMDDLLNSKLQQAKALQAVEDAQNALNTLQQTAAGETSQAQLALVNAQDALEEAQRERAVMDYPHSTDELVIEKAETDYQLAKLAYKDALQEYQKFDQKRLTNPERVRALNNLLTTRQKMETALATYNWYLLGYTDLQIAQADAAVAVAQANLEAAQANWDSLQDGLSTARIAVAQATLDDALREWERVKDGPTADDIAAAQAAIDIAQATLDQAELVAPFDGTITEVDVTTGDLVSPGDKAFRLDDLSSIYIDLQISEVDLTNLAVGQAAILEFDAIAGSTYNGEVTAIGMVGTVSQGLVNYPVTVRLTDAGSSIRPGMTASVSIVLAQHDNVLTVPSRAVRTSGGQQTVTVLFEGQLITVPVTTGLSSSGSTEITSSQLREGDVVVLNGTTASTTSTTNFMRGPGGFELGGGAPAGGLGGMFP